MKCTKLFWGALSIATLVVGFASCKGKETNDPDDPFKPSNGGGNTTPTEVTIDTTKAITCQAAADLAKSGSTETVVVKGYVTFAYNTSMSTKTNTLQQSAWLSDDKGSNAGVLKAQYCDVTDSVSKGDYVVVEGPLTTYTKTDGSVEYEIKNGKMELIRRATSGGSSDYTTVGKGTEDDPYTAADVLGLANTETTGSYAWVKAFIVGQVKGDATTMSSTTAEFVAPFTAASAGQNTNVLLGDAADESTLANCTPLQLPKGTIRSLVNLIDNADNDGQEILLYGELCKYFGVAGIKNPTYVKIGSKEAGNNPNDVVLFSETLLTKTSFNKFTIYNELGDSTWRYSGSTYGAKMSGYRDDTKTTEANIDWFISPAVDLSSVASATLKFESARGPKASLSVSTDNYKLYVSNDYTSGDPTAATWTELEVTHGTSAWSYVETVVAVPTANLKANCRVAFKYTCNDTESATWEIRNVIIK